MICPTTTGTEACAPPGRDAGCALHRVSFWCMGFGVRET